MAKLTATETAILGRAHATGQVGVEKAFGRGPQGGRVSTGHREFSAAMKLVARGILKIDFKDASTLSDGGYMVRICFLRLSAA